MSRNEGGWGKERCLVERSSRSSELLHTRKLECREQGFQASDEAMCVDFLSGWAANELGRGTEVGTNVGKEEELGEMAGGGRREEEKRKRQGVKCEGGRLDSNDVMILAERQGLNGAEAIIQPINVAHDDVQPSASRSPGN